MDLPTTPEQLWSCLIEPCELRDLAAEFEKTYQQTLVDAHGKLLSPLVRRGGLRFSKTHVSGLTVQKHPGAQYSLYESRERYEDRRFREDWLTFIEGSWTRALPVEAGSYFVRSADGFQSVHVLVTLPGGELHDSCSGFVTPGKVSNWTESWWSVRIPSLRGSK
jgi:hypothetical protein